MLGPVDAALIIAQRVGVLLVLVALGVLLRRLNRLDTEFARKLANLLLTVINPCVIVNAYRRPYAPEELTGYGVSLILAVLLHGVCALVIPLLILRREGTAYRQERLAAIYPNFGFMGIPLVRALLGETGVFYLVGFMSVQSVFLWSHGMVCLGGREQMNPRKMFVTPGIIAFCAGLILYFTQLPLPLVLGEALEGVASMNTPLAMIVTGVFLAEVRVRELTDWRIYRASALRLLGFPGCGLLLAWLLGFSGWFSSAPSVLIAAALAAGCPTAAFSILSSARLGLSGAHAAKLVALTTVGSIVTLPLITYLAHLIA